MHHGGWGGPYRKAQQFIFDHVAPAYVRGGYRAVSIDYGPGSVKGLRSVKKAVRAEAGRPGPLCLYGESSGGHLALLAAEQIARVDCVATYGAPTDFRAFERDARAHEVDQPGWGHTFDDIIVPVFGDDRAAWAPWEPARHTGDLRADALLMISADDGLVPPGQLAAVTATLPTVPTYTPPPGNPLVEEDVWTHGTASAAGRREIRRRLVALMDRASAARRVFVKARRGRCADANRPREQISARRYTKAIACLLSSKRRRVVADSAAADRTVEATLAGRVTPALGLRALRTTAAGRAALRRRGLRGVAAEVGLGLVSRVTLRTRGS